VTPDIVAEDPAFTWLASIQAELDLEQSVEKPLKEEVLLLGLRDFPYKEYARHLPEQEALAIKDNYERVVISTLKKLVIHKPNLVIRPLPMCTNHFGSDDRWFYRNFFRAHKALHPFIDNSLLGPEMAPIEYCKAFKQADALLAMRFHSLVFGLGIGINSVALDYTLGKGKVRSLAERYNAELVSMTNLKTEKLTDLLLNALNADKPESIDIEQLDFANSMAMILKEGA
jgi:polysaccharide pyruvyl transferase WcaK-like protein